MSADSVIMEAILRVEYKLDAIVKHLKLELQPMHFIGQVCPICHFPADYTVDFTAGVVVRRCNCKTGKVAATMPMLPVTTPTGAPNASPEPEPLQQPAGADDSSHRPGRKDR